MALYVNFYNQNNRFNQNNHFNLRFVTQIQSEVSWTSLTVILVTVGLFTYF